MTPKYVKLPTMSGPYTPEPNYFNLFSSVNNYINHLMSKSGTRSCFGSIKKHVGISKSAKGWTELAWEGFKPSNTCSILKCSTLTKAYALKKSVLVVKALESKVRALHGI